MPLIYQITNPEEGSKEISASTNYVQKKEQDNPIYEEECFFNLDNDLIKPKEAIEILGYKTLPGEENNKETIYSFFYIFSKKEMNEISKMELKEFLNENFQKDLCNAIQDKSIKPQSIKYVAKTEREKLYKQTDKEVEWNKAKQGQVKEGDIRINLLATIKSSENNSSQNLSSNSIEINMEKLNSDTENNFDKHFNYKRDSNESSSRLQYELLKVFKVIQ